MAALRVLVVDDDIDKADTLGQLLRLCGCRATTAWNGPGAVVACRRDRPHVAVLNLGLPDMDGSELARRLKGEVEGLFLIALSGFTPQPTAGCPVDFHLVHSNSFDALRWILGRLDWCLHGVDDASETSGPAPRVSASLPSTAGEMSLSGSA